MPKQIVTLRQAVLDELAHRKDILKGNPRLNAKTKAALQPTTVSALATAMHQSGHMAASTVHYWLSGKGHISDDKVDIILAHLSLKIKR